MPKKVLRRILTKNDKRKTAKAVIPLRFIDILVPICRDITSTCWVQSPLVLKQIFLTGNPPILYRIYVNRSHCLQAIKIPPKLQKSEVGEISKHGKSAHRNIVFFIRRAYPTYGYIKQSRQTVISHKFIGSASKASGSLIIVVCNFSTPIRVCCLHLGQYRGKFFKTVSYLILLRVLLPQTGQCSH